MGTLNSYVPGPGNYNVAVEQKSRFAMGIKLKDNTSKDKLSQPAPGHYKIDSTTHLKGGNMPSYS